jgi:hypothetical protein
MLEEIKPDPAPLVMERPPSLQLNRPTFYFVTWEHSSCCSSEQTSDHRDCSLEDPGGAMGHNKLTGNRKNESESIIDVISHVITITNKIIIIIIIIIIIVALQTFVLPWPLFQFLDPIHSR